MASSDQPRRVFLQLASSTAAAVALGCLGGCGSDEGESEPSGDQNVGNVASYPVGTLTFVGSKLVLGRDDGGFYAMTAICTHEQTNMQTDGVAGGTRVHCNNHGSTFDANGNVVSGPAGAPLVHYALDIEDDGSIVVHAGSVVDAATRVQPPTA